MFFVFKTILVSRDLPYDVSLLGLSYVDIWLKSANEEEPECLARLMIFCNLAITNITKNIQMLTLESRRFLVLGEVSCFVRTLPNH